MMLRRIALEALDVRAAALDLLGRGLADESPRWRRAAAGCVDPVGGASVARRGRVLVMPVGRR